MSNRRILPALILAGVVGFVGVHRFYVGRYITGLIQAVLFAAGALMLKSNLSGLFEVQGIDDLQDWVLRHPVHPLPVLLVGIPTFWALGDCVALAARKFRDGKGVVMTRWM